MTVAHTITSREQWLAMRSQDLTASDIGAAVGVDRFKTPLALFAEKAGMLMPEPENSAMRRGRWLEPAVLAAIRDENPDWVVEKCSSYYRDPALRLGATPDAYAITDQPGITNIQCKVVSASAFEKHWHDGPPLSYQLQTLCETMLMSAQQGLVAALIIDAYGARLELFPVPRHEAAEARIKAVATKFWADVEAGIMPRVEPARDAEVVAALYPASVPDKVLDLTGDNALGVLLPQYAVLRDQIGIDKKRLDAMATEIKAKLGEAEGAELPGWRITWKAHERKGYTVAPTTQRPLIVTELEIEDAAA